MKLRWKVAVGNLAMVVVYRKVMCEQEPPSWDNEGSYNANAAAPNIYQLSYSILTYIAPINKLNCLDD